MSATKRYDPLANLGKPEDARRGESGLPTGLRIGDLAYWDGTRFARLASGPNQYVLTAGGAGVAPSWAAAAGGAPTGAAGGDLGGTYPNPTVTQARGIRETSGPTTLTVGAVADGEYLKRSGSTVIGGTPAGGSPTITVDTYATITALTPAVGDQGYPTDSPYRLICYSAGTWTHLWGGFVVDPPPTTGWSWDNQGTATESTEQGSLTIEQPSAAGTNFRLRYRTAPATPWEVVLGIAVEGPYAPTGASASALVGGFRDGAGKIVQFLATNNVINVQRHASSTTSAASTPYSASDNGFSPRWVLLGDDGTDIYVKMSRSGPFNWREIHRETRLNYLADVAAYFWGGFNTSGDTHWWRLFHRKES